MIMRAPLICPFCCKRSDADLSGTFTESSDESQTSGVELKSKLLTRNFRTCLERHFGASLRVNLGDLTFLNCSQDNTVETCKDCLSIVESICERYHEMKCMELQLEWKVQSLRNIMRMADKVKSRKHLLKVTVEGCQNGQEENDPHTVHRKEMYKRVKIFRKDFLQKCSRHFSRTFPRVVVDNVGRRSEDNQNSIRNRAKVCTPSKESVRNFIDWALSLSVVVTLSGGTSSVTTADMKLNLSGDLDRDLLLDTTGDDMEIASPEDPHEFLPAQIPDFTPNSIDCGVQNQENSPAIEVLKSEDMIGASDDENENEDVPEPVEFPDGRDDEGDDDNTSPMNCDNEDVENIAKINSEAIAMEDDSIKPMENEADQNDGTVASEINEQAENISQSLTSEINDVVPEETGNIEEDIRDIQTDSHEEIVQSRSQGRYNLRAARTSKRYAGQYNDQVNSDSDSDGEFAKNTDDDSSSTCSESSNDDDDDDYDISDWETSTVKDNQVQCKLCSRTFKSEAWLQTHLRKKTCPRLHVGKVKVSSSATVRTRSLIDRQKSTVATVKPEYMCKEGECDDKGFENEEEYEHHKKLHGTFPCSFCDVVETFAPNLCIHEETHSGAGGDNEEKVEGRFYCPRCPYQVARKCVYIAHHLERHLNISKRDTERWECPICKLSIKKSFKDKHFTRFHDTSGINPNAIYKCDAGDCSAYFLKRHQLTHHLFGVHTKLNVVDKSAKISEKASVDKETVAEKEPTYVECKLCKKKFKFLSWLTEHEKNVHQRKYLSSCTVGKYKKFVRCPEKGCREKCRPGPGMELHKKLHGKFTCKFCSVEKSYAPDLALHEIEHSLGNPNVIANSDGDGNNDTEKANAEAGSSTSSKSIKYNCARCKYISTSKYHYLNHHLHWHLNLTIKSGYCEICEVSIMGRHEPVHFRTHHDTEGMDPKDIHKCDKCPAYFVLGIQLIRHQKRKHETLECPHCGKVAKHVKTLQSHIRTMHKDIDESQFTHLCQVPNCDKRYATKAELEWHVTYHHVYHEKEGGNVTCKICGKVCIGPFGIYLHMKHHDKPAQEPKVKVQHVCEKCGKEFESKHGLKAHAIFHTERSTWPFKCTECPRTCISQQKLDDHMRIHTKEKPFVCDLCGGKFRLRHHLKLHTKNHHGIIMPLLRKRSKKQELYASQNLP